ncbi:MAG: hypothetical protein IIA82_07900 [Thaumarchaeota archaeon]|nr:hypothetical protein [Nitrososphaerota archaeon]
MEEKETKKQFCGYCPVDKCLLDCVICNPKEKSGIVHNALARMKPNSVDKMKDRFADTFSYL